MNKTLDYLTKYVLILFIIFVAVIHTSFSCRCPRFITTLDRFKDFGNNYPMLVSWGD